MSAAPIPSRHNVVEVAPVEGGFALTFVAPDGGRRHLDKFPDLRRAKSWAEVQAFYLDADRVRVLRGKVGS